MIVIGSMWWNGTLAALCIGAGAYFAGRAVRRADGRAVNWAHVLMALGMAGMFSPAGDPVPPVAGAVTFALVGAWFVAVRVRTGGPGIDGPCHVAIGCAAMVLMYLLHGTGVAGDHVGHGGRCRVEHAGGGTGPPARGVLRLARLDPRGRSRAARRHACRERRPQPRARACCARSPPRTPS